MTVTIQIQARMGSSRLPGKALLGLGEKRVIEWVVDNCTESEAGDEVVVATSTNSENEAITRWCDRTGTTYARGAEEDLLERHLDVAQAFESDVVVRICGDCPFVPPWEIDRVVDDHLQRGADYTTNVIETVPTGVAVDVMNRSVLEELSRRNESHPVLPLRNNRTEWAVHESAAQRWENVGDQDISVDTPADYWTLEDAVTAVGADPIRIAEWVKHNG
jgi:spore coat polysaccharide biosynthesis protein SpsF